MILHENLLPADDSQEISCLIVIFEIAAKFYMVACCKEALAIRRIFSLVEMITNAKFSNFPKVLKIGVVWQ